MRYNDKMKQDISKEIQIPENVNVEINGFTVVVTGPLGKTERNFPHDFMSMEKRDNLVVLSSKKATKREKKITGAIAAHIKNMVLGVTRVFEYKLQVCSVHFPISVAVDPAKKFVIIKNFLGETKERKAEILEDTSVKIEREVITVTSIDKEKASQTAANIEMATRIKSRDRRVFQDGIFMIEKDGRKI